MGGSLGLNHDESVSGGPSDCQELVEEIRGMGLPAKRASSGTTPQINDLVIRGYLLAIDEGSAAKRVAIGFGSGGSELTVATEGFQMTAQGLRKSGGLDQAPHIPEEVKPRGLR